MFKLKGKLESADWGSTGGYGIAAQLARGNDPNIKLQPLQPYSELWLGSHPTLSSDIISGSYQGETLARFLKNKQSVLGNKNIRKFPLSGGLFPFTLKIISADKALPLQVHPNLEQAKELHQENPDVFKDANHKPKLLIGLNNGQLIAGFRPREEIMRFIKEIPQLKDVLGPQLVERFRQASNDEENIIALQKCVETLLQYDSEDIGIITLSLLKSAADAEDDPPKFNFMLGDLLYRLHRQHPSDVGLLFIYFLRVHELRPGEAVYINTNDLHSILLGDFLECSSLSDNTVIAAFHAKPSPSEVVCKLINFSLPAKDSTGLFRPHVSTEDLHVTQYNPMIKDFCVDRITLQTSSGKYNLEPIDSGSIVLVMSGYASVESGQSKTEDKNVSLAPGTVIFLPAMYPFCIFDVSSPLVLFRAFCSLTL